MSFDNIAQPTEKHRLSVRSTIEVLFEFNVLNPKLTFYRAVRPIDGTFRMEKRGEHAKKFRPAMWCNSENSLFKFSRIRRNLLSKITGRKK